MLRIFTALIFVIGMLPYPSQSFAQQTVQGNNAPQINAQQSNQSSDSSKVEIQRIGIDTGFNAQAERKNLGTNVNSQWNDIIPIISADGKTLYFDRKDYPLNTGGETDHDDIWYSEYQQDSTWSVAKDLSALNTRYPNAIFSILPDNNTALYWGAIDEMGRLTFALVHRTKTGWTQPELLHIKNFYNEAEGITASLAADGKTLLLAIKRKDSQSYHSDGGMNIYVSFLEDEAKNTWTEPKNLGNIINTPYGETTPLLAADGVTLYFSSARPGGIGDVDIYSTQRLDTTWTNWSSPQNLGAGFNIRGENFLNSITASGEYAYLSGVVENPSKNMDIFRIKMPKKSHSKAVVLVKGRVFARLQTPPPPVDVKGKGKFKNKTQEDVILPDTLKPLEAKIVYERLSDGKEIGIAHTDPRTGAYQIALPCGDAYGFRAELKGYLPVDDNLDITKLTTYQEMKRDIILSPLEVGIDVNLNNLFFDEGKADLRSESFPELDRLVTVIVQNPSLTVEIDGHTDDVGTPEFNKVLSLHRAQAVVSYLAKKGIDNSRLTAKGFGETDPVASNDTEEGKQKNRRVVLKILKE